MTYTDLLLSFILILLIYLLLEMKALRDVIAYYLGPRHDGEGG